MNEHEKLLFCIRALRFIALSYQQRIDRQDTPAYVFADECLAYIGEDIERIPAYDERLAALVEDFNRARKSDSPQRIQGAVGMVQLG